MKNIFEELGFPKDHRKASKVTQLVKHFDEVPDTKKKWPMLCQIKKDGCCAIVLNQKDTKIFSRSGKRFQNIQNLEKEFRESGAPRGVYFAELCNDDCSLETLSGIVNPNRIKPLDEDQEQVLPSNYLSYYDVMPIQDFIYGSCFELYKDRYENLSWMVPNKFDILELFIANDEQEANELFNDTINAGEEGIVLRNNWDWIAGHKGFRTMKKVRGVDFDLECIGVEEGKGKYTGLVANLFFKWKDTEIKAMLGKGWSHSDAREMFSNCRFKTDSPIGKIFQVYALQISSKGKLRLPKVGELRHDKLESDNVLDAQGEKED